MTSRLQARGKHFYATKQFSWRLHWSTSLHLSSLGRIDAILGQFSRASTISEMKWLGSLRLVCFHELWWILLSLTRAGGKPGNQMIIDHLFGFSWYTCGEKADMLHDLVARVQRRQWFCSESSLTSQSLRLRQEIGGTVEEWRQVYNSSSLFSHTLGLVGYLWTWQSL